MFSWLVTQLQSLHPHHLCLSVARISKIKFSCVIPHHLILLPQGDFRFQCSCEGPVEKTLRECSVSILKWLQSVDAEARGPAPEPAPHSPELSAPTIRPHHSLFQRTPSARALANHHKDPQITSITTYANASTTSRHLKAAISLTQTIQVHPNRQDQVTSFDDYSNRLSLPRRAAIAPSSACSKRRNIGARVLFLSLDSDFEEYPIHNVSSGHCKPSLLLPPHPNLAPPHRP